MNFLDLSVNVLRLIGIFPRSTSSKLIVRLLYIHRVLIFIAMVWTIVSMTIQLFVAPDLSQLTRIIDMWTMFLSGFYKWCFMVVFNDDFFRFSTALVEIQRQGTVALGRSAEANQFTANYVKTIRPVTLSYIAAGIFVAFAVSINPLLSYPIGDRSKSEYYNDPNSYPFVFWIPYPIEKSWVFVLYFFFHSMMANIIVTIYLGIDAFLFGAIYAIGGQIELLNLSIINIKTVAENSSSTDRDQVAYFTEKQQHVCFNQLKECLKHHILILSYIKKLRTDFNSLIIVDYLHAIISLTFALFQWTISKSIEESFVVVIFILMSLSHQFLNNVFGEFILQKQLSVYSALNDVPWMRGNKKIRNTIQLMILRSIKPTLITGFYLYKLSNESFLTFSKSLYTYYMVLRRVNVDDEVDNA